MELLNLSAAPSRIEAKEQRAWILPVLGGAVFAAVVLLLLGTMPGPRRDLDYLIIGAASMMTSLLAMFLALIHASN